MKYLLGIMGLAISFCGFGQTLETQVDEFANRLSSYFDGYTGPGTNHLGNTMLQGHQIQHGHKNWRIRYSLSLSGSLLSNSVYAAHNQNSDASSNSEFSYMGPRNSIFGNKDATIMRKYWLNEDGRKMVNPTNGSYIYTDVSLPGGLERGYDLIPSSFPYLEVRPWKGFILSAGYFPMGFILKDIEQKGVELKSSIWAAGLGIQVGRFTEIPVLSWLRFDVGTNNFNVGVYNIQNAYDLGLSADFAQLTVNQLDFDLNISTQQARATLAIPILDKNFVMAQIGTSSVTNSLSVGYDFSFKLDSEKAKQDYNLDIDDMSTQVANEYTRSETIKTQSFYSFGVMRVGAVGSFGLFFTNVPVNVVTFKFGVKLL
ncbi:MAG: hypothetical protein KDC92_11860 [Bacteroidetes bacterium]|nr:hypothetical protein [Bacteroidota bacterium]